MKNEKEDGLRVYAAHIDLALEVFALWWHASCAAHDGMTFENPCGLSFDRIGEVAQRFGASRNALSVPIGRGLDTVFFLTKFIRDNREALANIKLDVSGLVHELECAIIADWHYRKEIGDRGGDEGISKEDREVFGRLFAAFASGELTVADFKDVR